MLRLTNLANKYQRRTLRALYAQTQAYPYDAQLSSDFDRTVMFDSSTPAVAASQAVILPGLVASKAAGETVTLSNVNADGRAFGLFANFVGGELSDIPSDFDRVGVWRGAGGVFEILAPVWSDANDLAGDALLEVGNDPALEIYMDSNAAGQLESDGSTGVKSFSSTARLVSYLSANAIIVELLV